MKTDELIALLATQAAPVPPRAARRALLRALALALPLALAWMLAVYGLRQTLPADLALPMAWVKLLLPLGVAAGAFVAAQRLGRPGVPAGSAWWLAASPVLLLWAGALAVWLGAPADARPGLLMDSTWRSCVWNIAGIALPVFVCGLLAMRSLAPTRPALAGLAVGLLAGGAGASVYALHCPELGAPFLAVWYVLGMALPAAAGAALGRWLLRW